MGKLYRRGFLLGLAGLGLSSLLPASAEPSEGLLVQVATHLAGIPVASIPDQARPHLSEVARQLATPAPSPTHLHELASRWEPARELYKTILTAIYESPTHRAWEAIPFAAKAPLAIAERSDSPKSPGP